MPTVSRKGDSLSTGHICVGTTTLDTIRDNQPLEQIVF